MVDRVTLGVTTYLPLDNQWQIVLSGSVIDVPDASKISGSVVTADAAGSLPAHGKPVGVRNVRVR